MTKLWQMSSLVLLAVIAASCGEAAAPTKPTPVQVPSVQTIQADGTGYLIINVGSNSILLSVSSAGVTQLPATVVNVGPTPTPGPNPPPQPSPLSARGILFRDAALKATADQSRAATAQKLAFGYLNTVTRPYADADAMKADVGKVGDDSIPIAAAPAWVPFRIELAAQWDRLRQVPSSTVADYQALLRDASAGLTASYTP